MSTWGPPRRRPLAARSSRPPTNSAHCAVRACPLLRPGCVVARSSLPARIRAFRSPCLAPPVIGNLPTISCKRCYKAAPRVSRHPALLEPAKRPSSDFSSVRHAVNAREGAWIKGGPPFRAMRGPARTVECPPRGRPKGAAGEGLEAPPEGTVRPGQAGCGSRHPASKSCAIHAVYLAPRGNDHDNARVRDDGTVDPRYGKARRLARKESSCGSNGPDTPPQVGLLGAESPIGRPEWPVRPLLDRCRRRRSPRTSRPSSK